MSYVIKMKPYFTNVPCFWSSNYGWADLDDADQYNQEEMMCLSLPMNGEWKMVTEEGLEDV